MRFVDLFRRGGTLVARRAARRLRNVFEHLAHARRGHGRPKTKEQWDSQYGSGFWDRLESVGELPHYMVILGYVSTFPREPSILDVGCGNGRLAKLLRDFALGYSSYTGIDLSTTAIASIELGPRQRMKFEAADFEEWRATQTFDVIVFNEVLYYSRLPERTLARYLPHLSTDGVVVVSMCRSGTRHRIWKKLESLLAFPARTTLENESGSVWDVRMGVPRSRHPPAP